MYSVIQTDFKKNSCEIIEIIDNNRYSDINTYINNLVKNICTRHTIILDTSFKKDSCENLSTINKLMKGYESGNYLIKHNEKYCLYKKRCAKIGLSYSTNVYKSHEWFIIPFSTTVSKQLTNSSTNNSCTNYTSLGMTYDKFQLFQFHLNDMITNPKIMIIGKRGTGKTYIIRSILRYLEKINPTKTNNLIVAPHELHNPFYTQCGLNTKIMYKLDHEYDEYVKNQNSDINYVVFDDVTNNRPEITFSKKVSDIFYAFDNMTTWIMAAQTPLGVTPDIILNFDYIFLLAEDSVINKKKMWDNYANMFPSLDCFNKVFTECTKDFKCMVIDNRKPTDTIQEKVFWFKAPN